MTPVETLRHAAKVLREQAAKATPGPWGVGNDTCVGSGMEQVDHGTIRYRWPVAEIDSFWRDEYEDDEGQPHPYEAADDAAYIASMHPGVGLALADLLQTLSWMPTHATNPTDLQAGVKVARLLLGEVTP